MADQLESALVIELSPTIRWEAALDTNGDTAGKLTAVDLAKPFDVTQFNRRDRELAYRDLINANAVVKVGLEIASIFGGAVSIPRVEGQTVQTLPYVASDIKDTSSQVVHVRHADVPTAALASDMDLAGRDALIYETLATACEVFRDPPLEGLQSGISDTSAWSLGEEVEERVNINSALPLDRDAFANPDKHLAHRDNLVAAYASRICQVLKNPFAYATRLYVAITGTDEREVEVYSLIKPPYVLGSTYNLDDEVWYHGDWWRALRETRDVPTVQSEDWTTITDSSTRIWTAEPALSDRNRIVYDVADKTLKWYRENNDVSSVPQLFALSVPGIFEGQYVDTVLAIPEQKDAQFWRKKAARIVFAGTVISDIAAVTDTTFGTNVLVADDAAVMTVPQNTPMRVLFPGATLEAGRRYQVSALVVPQPVLKVFGDQTSTEGVTIADRGLTFDGAYMPTTLTAGDAVLFSLQLPAGVWTCTMEYTNLGDVTNGFGVGVTTQDVTQSYTNTVRSDAVPLLFEDANSNPLTNGDLVQADPFTISSAGNQLNISITWAYGPGLFHLRSLTFEQLTPPSLTRYSMEGNLTTELSTSTTAGASTLDVYGSPTHFGVMPFDFTTVASGGTYLNLLWKPTGETEQVPLMVRQVSLHEWVENDPTPDALGFEGFRQDCLNRAEKAAQQAWNKMVNGYEGVVPVSVYNGTWSRDTMEEWISLVEIYEPRLREVPGIESGAVTDNFQYEVTGSYVVYNDAQYFTGDTFYGTLTQSEYTGDGIKQLGAFKRSQPGHLGKLGLMPYGVVYNYQSGTIAAPSSTDVAMPFVVTLQPWMIEAGAYVSQPDFWLVDGL